ncbi:MAG: hypothetical protein ABI217_09490 [Chthoniobacterales bacterium]
MKPTFYPTPSHFRKWLRRHHATAKELWVGFYKKGLWETQYHLAGIGR